MLFVFGIWMLFFDQNNWIRQWHLSQELNEAREQMQFYRDEYVKDSTFLHQLKTRPEVQEKYARENYLMKKDGETIFVIVREDE